jgi:hypothetical protein
VSEDLARRFLLVELDAHMENPESGKFRGDIKAEVTRDRLVLLGAARWGHAIAARRVGLSRIVS